MSEIHTHHGERERKRECERVRVGDRVRERKRERRTDRQTEREERQGGEKESKKRVTPKGQLDKDRLVDSRSQPEPDPSHSHAPSTTLAEEQPEMRTHHEEVGDHPDDTHGDGRHVAVFPYSSVTRGGVGVLRTGVAHLGGGEF